MTIIRLFPVFLSALLISAHFHRAGLTAIALFSLFIPGILLVTKPWAVRIVQVFLLLGAAEWARTLYNLVQLRMEYGIPWLRLAFILVGIAFFTLASTLVFHHAQLKKRYNQC